MGEEDIEKAREAARAAWARVDELKRELNMAWLAWSDLYDHANRLDARRIMAREGSLHDE